MISGSVHAHAQLLVALRHSLLLRLKMNKNARDIAPRPHQQDANGTSRPHVSQAGKLGAFPAACPETAPRHLENEGATSETGVGSAHSSSSRVAGDHEGRQRPPCGFSAGKMCVSQPAARFPRGVVVFDLRRGKHPEMAEITYGDGLQVLQPLCLCLNPFRFRGAAGLPFVDP